MYMMPKFSADTIGAITVATITGSVQIILALLSQHDRRRKHRDTVARLKLANSKLDVTTSKIDEVKLEVNGKMEKLVEANGAAGEARGIIIGVQQERERTDAKQTSDVHKTIE